MKKILIVFIIVLLTGCHNDKLEKNDSLDNQIEEKQIQEEKEIVLTLSHLVEYISLAPKDMYKDADLVVTGYYQKDERIYLSNNKNYYTVINFEIENILKGNENNKDITVSYMGALVPLEEFLKDKTEEQIKAYKLNDIDTENKYVEYGESDIKIRLNKYKKYLLFLNKDTSNKSNYISISNGHSILEITSDMIYDKVNRSYLNINNLN